MISSVVLTRNSSSTLAQTLESLAWCDEIVVVDDNSSDETVRIAKEHHAVIFSRDLDGDFAAQRNFGLSKAKGDWVVFVDADEVVSDKLAAELMKSSHDNTRDGYYLKRDDYVWGKVLRHGETSRVRLLRFSRKGAGIWTRPIHEVWAIHGYLGHLVNPLQHTPHPTVRQFLEDINVYSTANAWYFYQHGVRVSWISIVAYPVAKFFINYIWFGGFLDGTAGTVIALMMSFHSFLTRAKLWQLWQKNRVYAP